MEEKKHSLGALSQNLYGCGEFFNGGAFVIINTFFTVFLIKALGMPAVLAGTIPLVGKILDAITDPIMGNITDRTVSKFGAKRFYILLGAFASSITFVLLWVPIRSSSPVLLYIFYLFMYCLFSTGFTVLMVPYNGLLPDMIDDYSTRSKFSNVRMIWSTLGSMVCGLVPTFIITDTTNASLYIRCALIFGVLFLCTSLATFAGTWEKQKAPVRSDLKDSFTQAVSVYKSHSFRLFIGISTGLSFLDHMLMQIVHHGGIMLTINASGDLEVDEHHTMEDVAITLGQALHKSLLPKTAHSLCSIAHSGQNDVVCRENAGRISAKAIGCAQTP